MNTHQYILITNTGNQIFRIHPSVLSVLVKLVNSSKLKKEKKKETKKERQTFCVDRSEA